MQAAAESRPRPSSPSTTVDGTVAGGAVTVTVNGIGELVGVDDPRPARSTAPTPTTWPTSAT